MKCICGADAQHMDIEIKPMIPEPRTYQDAQQVRHWNNLLDKQCLQAEDPRQQLRLNKSTIKIMISDFNDRVKYIVCVELAYII
jgi:hypothetical protein